MTTSYLKHAAVVVVGSVALAAPVRGQVGVIESTNPLVGCYSFDGADEQSGSTITERFRLTAEPSFAKDLPGPWQVVTAVPGETPRTTKASWSVGPNTMIRVVWVYDTAKVLLQFPQIEDGLRLPVEGMLAGPGPEPGVAQTARGYVVRFPC